MHYFNGKPNDDVIIVRVLCLIAYASLITTYLSHGQFYSNLNLNIENFKYSIKICHLILKQKRWADNRGKPQIIKNGQKPPLEVIA